MFTGQIDDVSLRARCAPYPTPVRKALRENDFIDAAAIAEACGRPDMRFVPVEPVAAQIQAACHRLRESFVAERTAYMSRIGAIFPEFGLSFPTGRCVMKLCNETALSIVGKSACRVTQDIAT